MKKIKSPLVALISIILIFSGCEKHINEDKIAEQQCGKIIECLNNDDAETLKSMFCNKIQSSESIDEQIQNAFDFFEGKTVSYELQIGGGEEATDDGETSRLAICPGIVKINTDSDKIYKIYFDSLLIYRDDKDREGISEIKIYLQKDNADEDEKCIVGDFYLVNPEYK